MEFKKTEKKYNDNFLKPPTPTKQFLISPPASPPVGWMPCEEAKPIVNDLSDLNYDLINKLAQLAPGESHELHPQSDEHGHPAIVVHICEDDINVNTRHRPPIIISESRDNSSDDSDNEQQKNIQLSKIKIQQTRAPDSFLKSKEMNG